MSRLDRAERAIHPTASVSPDAHLGKDVRVGAFALIEAGAEIGDDTIIEAGAVIYENVSIGPGSFVGAQCILGERQAGYLESERGGDPYENPPLRLGKNSVVRSGTIIYSGCTIGVAFQTGHRAIIREDSIFGDNCSFGTLSQCDGRVRIGNKCRFHNNVFIATYTTCEDDVHFYPMSCTVDSLHPPCQKGRQGPYLESGVIIGAKVLLLPRVRLGRNSVVAGASVVTHDIEPGMVVVGAPARAIKKREEVRCHLEDRPAYEVAFDEQLR
ncbi:MAG: hypothetical protein IPM23_25220 [Candidatus Melainabacteria bacterium]|nr:hypothetical protein [Candidatus Melainabacteria bacterium]